MRKNARRTILACSVAAATGGFAVLGTAPAQAALPTSVSAATARSYLASLTVTAEHSRTGYSRNLFPHWITISGAELRGWARETRRSRPIRRPGPTGTPTRP